MNLGNSERTQEIQSAWSDGREIEGWAVYWDMVYRYLADLLDNDPAVRAASLVVRFEQLCDDPATTLRAVMNHCAVDEYRANSRKVCRKYSPSGLLSNFVFICGIGYDTGNDGGHREPMGI